MTPPGYDPSKSPQDTVSVVHMPTGELPQNPGAGVPGSPDCHGAFVRGVGEMAHVT
jgi:hypothetical protein